MNLDFLKWQKINETNSHAYKLKELSQLVFDRIYPHGVVQCVTKPTHFWPGREPSGLDHIYTNHPEKLSQPLVVSNGGSDHDMLMCTRFTKQIISRPRIVSKRSYRNFDASLFINEVRNLPMWQVYSCEDPEKAVYILSYFLTSILDRLAPIKTYQVRKNYCPWLSDETKLLIHDRNLAHKKATDSKYAEDWNRYKLLRNRVNSRLRTEKHEWQQQKISYLANSSSNTWKSVKKLLGWASGGPPSQLFDGNKMYNKPSQISSIMNNHFVNKVRSIRKNLPPSSGDPFQIIRQNMQNKSCKFQFQSVHPDVVLGILSSLKNTKSCGIDNIDSYVLKIAKFELVPAITHIVNLCISTGTFPQQWKLAKVVPLHKKDSKSLPENYRPVALLCVMSKILEKTVFLQLIGYFEGNSILHPSHHGFRSLHSTCTALLELHDRWLRAVSKDEFVAVVLVDLSAAFDVVDHALLLRKLSMYGLDQISLKFMKSYLYGRQQVVLVDGHLSESLPLEAGVPQGSILGPLLYVLFTNDLPDVLQSNLLEAQENESIVCYADDSTVSISHKDPNILNDLVDQSYYKVARYMADNKLKLNSSKTHLMILQTEQRHRRLIDQNIKLNTGNEIISPSECEKLLGAYVSQNLKWDQHVKLHSESAIRVLSTRLNALYKVSQFASFKTRKMVANGIFNSSLIYMIQLWGNSSQSLINCLQILQNKAARFITKQGIRTPVKTLLQQCGWLSVQQLVVYHNCLSVYKIKYHSKPAYFSDRFGGIAHDDEDPVSRRTRLSLTDGIRLQGYRIRNNLEKQSFVYNSINSWNSLPPQIRQSMSMASFKRNLREWILQTIPIR